MCPLQLRFTPRLKHPLGPLLPEKILKTTGLHLIVLSWCQLRRKACLSSTKLVNCSGGSGVIVLSMIFLEIKPTVVPFAGIITFQLTKINKGAEKHVLAVNETFLETNETILARVHH